MRTNEKINVSAAPDYLVQRLVMAGYNTMYWNGYEAYYVGGSVRDSLLGITPKDWDIATDAHPNSIVELFSNPLQNVDMSVRNVSFVDAAVAYPVVLVDGFEVATFRKDVAGAARSENTMSLNANMRDDAMRRDFTINALYADRWGNVFDPTGFGLSDLQARLLRFVGDPVERLAEDPLRALRAVRFASRLGFQLEAATRQALLNVELTFR